MRKLRDSLIHLFQGSWHSHNPAARIKATIIREALALLTVSPVKPYGVGYRLLSHDTLHRYIMVVHCPDQAFYPDAIRTYLQKQGIQPIHQESILFSNMDIAHIKQNTKQIQPDKALFLVLHLAAATTDNIKRVHQDIQHILAGVYQSVVDFPSMFSELERIVICLSRDEPETADLLQWMVEGHYLFFGLNYLGEPRKNKGICKNKRLLSWLLPTSDEELAHIPEAAKPGMDWLHLSSTFLHLYSATNVKAVRICWEEGAALHSVIMIGHFSRGARYINASQLPHLREMWHEMASDTSIPQSAFYKREIRILFDRTPKSLLHSISIPQWLQPFKNIVDMNSPTQVVVSRLSPRNGNIDYLLIALDKQRFGNNIWAQMQRALTKLDFQLFGSENYTVGATQLIFVAVNAKRWPPVDRVHQAMSQCIIFWKDLARLGLLQGGLPPVILHDGLLELSQTTNLYQDQFAPDQFVRDVLVREQIHRDGKTKVRATLHHEDSYQVVEVHVLTPHALPLGVMTEKLNAFSLVTMEQSLIPFHHAQQPLYICRFRCEAPEQLHAEGLPRLSHGIQDVFNQLADHDPLNALLILCGLSIRDVLVLITLRNHLAQLMADVSPGALTEAMLKNPQVSKSLFRIFEGKHRPAMPVAYLAQAKADFDKAMTQVQSLKEDTWFRALEELVHSSVRSNAWQRSEGEALAVKINPSQLAFAPMPHPYREIFVHGVFIEGVHLRAGSIARGGLRYSDRPTDFRTEVLELMATQVVKNGQIIPTGAKGGFVVRDGHGQEFVLAQYHQFVFALLAITDNRVAGKSVPPEGIRIDEGDSDDTYLVVAADKGTARYSDDANAEALAVDFWLGDAFASGGSHGYDHKAFGITARGAWVCAAHHFEQLKVDLWHDEVTVVGIGDMGGDVFGNGMLLNPNIKLVAAFNHAHIFLDPTPDVRAAFTERKRLFKAVLGWDDYDVSLISAGGGVFNRTAKSIMLTPEMQSVLGINIESCSGEALIRAILQAPVDLLYNGGIGTYIKASFETDAVAQDPANNPVRVDANTLRCKVLNEGGNLGLTHAARIEYAKSMGMINTDAIDNAAGVNMSDHEVNLKILLTDEPFAHRNQVLKSVANYVAEQCLIDNKEQAIALSLAELIAVHHMPRLQYLQKRLFDENHLRVYEEDTSLFALRPILSEWLGYEKNRIHQALDAASFCEKSVFGEIFLKAYFPDALHKKYNAQIMSHPLSHDIAHTRISSYILNRYGLACVHYLQDLTTSSVEDVVQALLMTDTLLDMQNAYEIMLARSTPELHLWYAVQQKVLSFAEGLLALQTRMDVDQAWLKVTRKNLRGYAKRQSMDEKHLADLVVAIPLCDEEGQTLNQCLGAVQACLEALPFSQLEAVLRTPLWVQSDAHDLRREWLKRLMFIKKQAAKCLLLSSKTRRNDVLAFWQEHPLQEKFVKLLVVSAEMTPEQKRLRYILAMTHLQNIVDQTDDVERLQ